MYIFNPPFETGDVYVAGDSRYCGCTTVAELCKTDTNSVFDVGVNYDTIPEGSINLVYVHNRQTGLTLPDWVVARSYLAEVVVIDFNTVRYTEASWELQLTDHALLLELEKLLPGDNPVRQARDKVRSKYK